MSCEKEQVDDVLRNNKLFSNVEFVLITVTDVDECAEQNGRCPQNCTNDVGNHTCSCFSGYTDVYDNGTLCTGNDYRTTTMTIWTYLSSNPYCSNLV